jgi:spermidine/putrescine-binding protein
MNSISIYLLANGQYSRTVGAPTEELLLLQVKDGEKGLFDIANPSSYYLDSNGETLIQIPPKPSEYSIFDYTLKEWVDPRTDQQKYDDAVNVAIPQRNELLYASDWTQIPNNPLTAEKQQEWAVYRQELRDITIQAGYPFNIVWPVQPE